MVVCVCWHFAGAYYLLKNPQIRRPQHAQNGQETKEELTMACMCQKCPRAIEEIKFRLAPDVWGSWYWLCDTDLQPFVN